MLIYYLIFSLILFFLLAEDFFQNNVDKYILLMFCLLILSLFAGLRPAKASTDYENYFEVFNNAPNAITFIDRIGNAEPFYIFIPSFFKFIGFPIISSFVLYAFLGTFLKGIAIMKYSKYWFVSLIVYFSNFFLLHEFTQIRIGVAIGIYLLSIPFIFKRNFLLFALAITLACCFHYSAIILLSTFWISDKPLNKPIYLLCILGSLIIGILKIDLISLLSYLPISFIKEKTEFYIGANQSGLFNNQINLFNVFSLIDIFTCIILLKYSRQVSKHQVGFNFLLKLYFISLFFFFLLSSLPAVAYRIREIFQIVQIFLIPCLIFIFKERYVGKIVIVLISLLFLYVQTYYANLVNPYF